MRFLALSALAATLAATGCAGGESAVREGFDARRLRRVAVVEVSGKPDSEAARNEIADFFVWRKRSLPWPYWG